MAGFDLTCLGSGVFLAWAAWKMQHRVAPQAKAERARLAAEKAKLRAVTDGAKKEN